MLKIACCGLGVTDIKKCVEAISKENVEATALPDMEAARGVKAGQYDYLIGSCLSGQGGALGVAIAVLGYMSCKNVSVYGCGKMPTEEEVRKVMDSGNYKAFGMVSTHAKTITPYVIKYLLEKNGLA